jgi:hypothetical protein
MDLLNFKIQHDGHKNAVLQVSGYVSADTEKAITILELSDLLPVPKSFRIESMVFALQEKMGCLLWWVCKEDIYPILPIEGKGALNFNDMQGLHSPHEGVLGLAISCYGVGDGKHLLITLDLTKQ